MFVQEHWEKEMPDLQLEWDVPFRCVPCTVTCISDMQHCWQYVPPTVLQHDKVHTAYQRSLAHV